MMEKLLKLLRTISPATAGTLGEKAVNIGYMILALAFGLVLLACRMGFEVPGADCNVIQASQTAPQ